MLINWTLFIAGNVICPIVVGLILHYAIQFLDNKGCIIFSVGERKFSPNAKYYTTFYS
nr:MAG TPA: toxin [Caudoviricetes sp.]